MSTTYDIERYIVLTSIGADAYTTDIAPTGQDTSNIIGNLLVNVNIGVTVQGNIAIGVQHNDVATAGDSGWAAVPAALLYDPATGLADTFDAVTSAAGNKSNQTLALNLQGCKRYVRVIITFTSSATAEVAAQLFGRRAYMV